MAHGKYLSFEEARQLGKLGQFGKEHPAEADADRFSALLDAMCRAGRPSPENRTSGAARRASYAGTRIRQGTSEDASD